MATHRGEVAHHEVSSEGGVKEESKSPLERPTIGCGEEPLSRIWQESSKVVLYNSLQYSTEQRVTSWFHTFAMLICFTECIVGHETLNGEW